MCIYVFEYISVKLKFPTLIYSVHVCIAGSIHSATGYMKSVRWLFFSERKLQLVSWANIILKFYFSHWLRTGGWVRCMNKTDLSFGRAAVSLWDPAVTSGHCDAKRKIKHAAALRYTHWLLAHRNIASHLEQVTQYLGNWRISYEFLLDKSRLFRKCSILGICLVDSLNNVQE